MYTGYRFYLLSDGHVVGVQTCECSNDEDALKEADAFLQASVLSVVEVWDGLRRVAILSKPTKLSPS